MSQSTIKLTILFGEILNIPRTKISNVCVYVLNPVSLSVSQYLQIKEEHKVKHMWSGGTCKGQTLVKVWYLRPLLILWMIRFRKGISDHISLIPSTSVYLVPCRDKIQNCTGWHSEIN
jgi:hypothetical protein